MTNPNEAGPALSAKGVTKTYGGIAALQDVDFSVAAGEVHALLGENGAGKSTLVKTLTGLIRPDEGTVSVDGQARVFAGASDATAAGIAVVTQELSLFPDLDVLTNLFLPRLPRRRGMVHRQQMRKQAMPILAEVGLDVDPDVLVSRLTLAERQLLEIASALLADPRILVLDEPTSALGDDATERLLHILRVLRNRGVAVVFVSHILEEVMAVSDTVTVLRDGQVALAAAHCADLTITDIVRAILGGVVLPTETAAPIAAADDDDRRGLSVHELSAPGLHPATIRVRAGEIVGLAGVAGAGHTTLLGAISGNVRGVKGTVRFPDEQTPTAPPRNRRAAVRRGLAVVSGDRGTAVLPDAPIWQNVASVRTVALGRTGHWVSTKRLRRQAEEAVARVHVKYGTIDQPIRSLSGGNQQKVVLAGWLLVDPSVILLDDPTRGVDVGAKAEMHRVLRETGSDRAILLCSTDIDELVSASDRVLVFRRGRIVRELRGAELTRHELLAAMN